MRTGLLRHHVQIQRLVDPPPRNAYGEPEEVWETLVSRYANIEVGPDVEIWQGNQLRGVANFKITMRYYALTPAMRIKWGSRIFNLFPADNPGERGRGTEMIVMAREEV